jgi:beta-lactam-binding protein with PASTA domain
MKLRPIRNFFQVALLVMLLVAVALLSAITTMHFAIHGAEVQVPSLKGMTVADARSQTAGMGLNLEVDNRYYSSDVAAGHILSQSPAPSTVVRREWRVRVAERLGPQKVDVPQTVGIDERMAALKLRRAGLEVGVTAQLAYGSVAAGTVLAQDPPAHAQGIERPSVNLLVAAPSDAQADGFVMPELIGMPVVAAQAQLVRVGMKVVPPVYVTVPVGQVGQPGTLPRPPVNPGSVTAQQPTAGSRVDLNTIVNLTVAK